MQNIAQMQLLQLKAEHMIVRVYILNIFLIISFALQNCFFPPPYLTICLWRKWGDSAITSLTKLLAVIFFLTWRDNLP